MPYNNATGEVDKASISADGSTYTNPKFMVTIISGAAGDKENDTPYNKADFFPSYTGTENCACTHHSVARLPILHTPCFSTPPLFLVFPHTTA